VTRFLAAAGAQRHREFHLDPAALAPLQAYPWPGNIRELQHVVERAALVCGDGLVRPQDLNLSGEAAPAAASPPEWPSLEEHEREYLMQVLAHTGGQVHGPGGAAALLGIPATTLAGRLKRLGLPTSARRG
jgi:transcriptional regulator of acetoin/glycerol metabolism